MRAHCREAVRLFRFLLGRRLNGPEDCGKAAGDGKGQSGFTSRDSYRLRLAFEEGCEVGLRP
jgi:hypothetical protein